VVGYTLGFQSMYRVVYKTSLVEVIFKNSVRTAKKTPHFTVTKINWLTLFKGIIAVYSEGHTKHRYRMRVVDRRSKWYV
jgi:hypothetical protein